MSVHFLDGPAASKVLGLRRAPIFLRVVIGPRGKVDALDLRDDTPRPGETVHVYRQSALRFALADDVYVCVRGRGGFHQAAVADADYRHMPEVDGEQLRETAAWRAWVMEQPLTPVEHEAIKAARERKAGSR